MLMSLEPCYEVERSTFGLKENKGSQINADSESWSGIFGWMRPPVNLTSRIVQSMLMMGGIRLQKEWSW